MDRFCMIQSRSFESLGQSKNGLMDLNHIGNLNDINEYLSFTRNLSFKKICILSCGLFSDDSKAELWVFWIILELA